MADLLNQFTNSMPGASGPSSPQPSYPSSNMTANNTFGSYANPSYEQSGLGTLNGAGGSSGALPLEGQYGIVKMASGGRVGLRSVAKELQDMGRGGDTILAHINPQEAALLKRMGGSGTINPATGLPEYWGIKLGPVRIGSDYGGISVGRTSIGDVLDKSGVADLISKLGPVAPMAAAYFGGPLAAGIVGGIGKEGKFNFQRALMSGALAYGAQNLAQGLSEAGTAGTAASSGAATAPIELGVPGTEALAGEIAQTGLRTPGVFDQLMAGDFSGAASTAGQNVGQGISSAYNTMVDPSTYTDMGSKFSEFGDKAANVGRGAYNLSTGAPGAAEAFKASGATLTNTALPMYAGATGVMALDEAQKMQDEADLANAKSQEEYNAIMARIEASRQRGIAAMQRNPYMFAYGGPVDDEPGTDDLAMGGIAGLAKGGMPPRFLSGGGDGMSDDIPAVIGNKQPARLADGEFVIPADVVSHLGNGSSKAGAKQLYSMMDKVRTARTGNKKQGKQITPAKYMPA